jgi:hypothetical protein
VSQVVAVSDLARVVSSILLQGLLLFETLQLHSDILRPSLDQAPQEGSQLLELSVVGAVVPSLDGDAVVGLGLEILLYIVDD